MNHATVQMINPDNFEGEMAGLDEHTLRTRDEYLATQQAGGTQPLHSQLVVHTTPTPSTQTSTTEKGKRKRFTAEAAAAKKPKETPQWYPPGFER